MDISDGIVVSIVGGVSALLGALIPTVMSYLNLKSERKYKMDMVLLEKQKEIYQKFIQNHQKLMNSMEDENDRNQNFKELQQSVHEICLYGDDDTSMNVKSYFDDLVQSMLKKSSLSRDEHVTHQTNIINCMRKNLKLSKFDRYEFISFNPPK